MFKDRMKELTELREAYLAAQEWETEAFQNYLETETFEAGDNYQAAVSHRRLCYVAYRKAQVEVLETT